MAPYPITVLGRIDLDYPDTPNRRALSAAKQYTLAVLVAAGRGGIDIDMFRGLTGDGAGSVEALRMSITRLRDHLPSGALPGAVGGRYRLDAPLHDVDAWCLEALVADRSMAYPSADRLRHLLRPHEPYAAMASTPALVTAAEHLRRLQRRLVERVADDAPELLRDEVLDDVYTHVAEDPYNERLVLACSAALARSGHRRDALNLLARARRELTSLGLGVSRQLDELEQALLDGGVALHPVTTGHRLLTPELPRLLTEQLANRLVGPVDHVATLRRALATTTGPRSIVTVEGRSGVGKTRACAELAAAARDAGRRVLYLAPVQEGGAAMAPFLASLPALGQQVGEILARDTDVESQKAAIWAATIEAIDAVAAGEPLVLVIDDCQWIDSFSAQFVAHLASTVAGNPSVLVLAGRDDASESTSWATLAATVQRLGAVPVRVDALEPGALAQLVRARRPGLSEAQVAVVGDELFGASGGLPGIAIPLLDSLDEATLALPTMAGLPPDRALDAAVAQVGDDARSLGLAAAVVGSQFDMAMLGAIAELPPDRVMAGVDELVRRGLLVERSFTAFALPHVLVQAAFVSAAIRSRVAAAHLRAADLFADDVHRRAWHLAEAVPLVPAGTASAALLASARLHLGGQLHRDAARRFRKAEELAGPLDVEHAGLYARALDLSGAADLARQVRADAFAEACRQGAWRQALRVATSGLPEAEPIDGDPQLVAWLEELDAIATFTDDDAWTHRHHLARQLAIVGRIDDAAAVAGQLAATATTPERRVDAAVLRRHAVAATTPPENRLALLASVAAEAGEVDAVRLAGFQFLRAIDLYEAGRTDAALLAASVVPTDDERLPVLRRWHRRLFDAMVASDRGEVELGRERRRSAFEFGIAHGLAEAHNGLLVAEFVDLWLRGRVAALRPAVDAGLVDPDRSLLMRAGAAVILHTTGAPDDAIGHATEVVRSVRRSPASQGVAALALVSAVIAELGDDDVRETARAMLRGRGDSLIVVGAGAACLGPTKRYLAMLAPASEREALLDDACQLADRSELAVWRLVARRDLELLGKRPLVRADVEALLVDDDAVALLTAGR